MHKNDLNFQSSILNAIFAEGICDTRVSAYGILRFEHFLVGFTHDEMSLKQFEPLQC